MASVISSDPKLENARKRHIEFESACAQHTDLFSNPYIREYNARNHSALISGKTKIPVGQDHFQVIDAAEGFLYTRGLMTCAAFCSRGLTLEGKTILFLCHNSFITPSQDITRLAKEQLRLKGCVPDEVTTYVVGGMKKTPDNPEGTLEEEIELLEMAKEENILGVQFNLVQKEEDDSLSVMFTAEGIFYQQGEILESSESDEDAGEGVEDTLNELSDISDVSESNEEKLDELSDISESEEKKFDESKTHSMGTSR